MPIISQVPGFVAYSFVDAGSDVMLSTSIFADQASAEESSRRAAEFMRQQMASVLPNPPQITGGAVVAHHTR